MKKKIIEALVWCVIAFLIGSFVTLGGKTIEVIWPTKPISMEHSVKEIRK